MTKETEMTNEENDLDRTWIDEIEDEELETFVNDLDAACPKLSSEALDRTGQLVSAELQLAQLRRKIWRVAMSISALAATVLLILGFLLGRNFPMATVESPKNPPPNVKPKEEVPVPEKIVEPVPVEDTFAVTFEMDLPETGGADSLLSLDDYQSLTGGGL